MRAEEAILYNAGGVHGFLLTNENEDASAPTGASQAGANDAWRGARRRHQCLNLRRTDSVVVASAGVGSLEQRANSGYIAGIQSGESLLDAMVFVPDMAAACAHVQHIGRFEAGDVRIE